MLALSKEIPLPVKKSPGSYLEANMKRIFFLAVILIFKKCFKFKGVHLISE